MIRIGIVGSGYIAETHARSVAQHQDATLAGVAGGTRASEFAARHSTNHFTEKDDLLTSDSIDAVILSSPHGTHRDETLVAAAAGKHVFVEKPMATTAAECEEMIDAARSSDILLMVDHSQRYFPTNRRVHEILRNGPLGRLLVIRAAQMGAGLDLNTLSPSHWARDPQFGGMGTTLGYGIHNIDRVLWWLGEEPAYVYGQFTEYGLPGMEQGSFINFRSVSGVDVSTMFQGSFTGKVFDHQRDCAEIVCEKGHIECQAYRRVRVSSGDRDWETVEELNFRQQRQSIYASVISDFIRAITSGQPAAVSPEDGLRAVKLIEDAYTSHHEAKVVRWSR